MRIKAVDITNAVPVLRFSASDLSDTIVVAGQNGVGKTRLFNHIMQHLRGEEGRKAVTSTCQLVLEATCETEEGRWGKLELDLSDPNDFRLYNSTVQDKRSLRHWKSSVFRFESNRTISKLDKWVVEADLADPSIAPVAWQTGFNTWGSRWQNTLHSMFKILEHQKQGIASNALRLKREGRDTMGLHFDDKMAPFRDTFFRLLAPKEMEDPSVRNQTLVYSLDGESFSTSQLSSGEQEVLNIAFDFQLREPTDCIIFFDEPELHLHPELSHRLIQTLQTIGERNQFIFSTHSPEIITASLNKSVFFLSPPRRGSDGNPENQAVQVLDTDETNEALRLLGHSIGVITLGERIVLIEGETSSLDKEVYGSIIQSRFTNLVLVPSGGKHTIQSFETIADTVLSKSIWGVEFFMLCDHDSAPIIDSKSAPIKLRILSRYHLENYFLDEHVLAEIFSDSEPQTSWLRDPLAIEDKLEDIARNSVPYGTALSVAARVRKSIQSIDIMPRNCQGKTLPELARDMEDIATKVPMTVAVTHDG